MMPENISPLESISPADHQDRAELRRFLADRFAAGRPQ